MPEGFEMSGSFRKRVFREADFSQPLLLGVRNDKVIDPIQQQRAGFLQHSFRETAGETVAFGERLQASEDVVLCVVTERPVETFFAHSVDAHAGLRYRGLVATNERYWSALSPGRGSALD